MAINAKHAADAGFSAERRFQVGANVTVAVAGALLLVVLVNWFAALRPWRMDMSHFGGYGLSDRTRSILDDFKGDVTISLLYSVDETGRDPTRYLDRVQDYCDELRLASPSAKVETIRSHNARARLVSRITGTFSGEAEKHKAALAAFENLATELGQAMTQKLAAGAQLQAGDAWLNEFPIFADVLAQLRQDEEKLRKTAEDVRGLTSGSGVPKYTQAVDRINSDLATLKNDFSAMATRLGELATLAETVTGESGAESLAALRTVPDRLPPLVAKLREAIGQAGDPMPPDLKAALKKFADEGVNADREIQNTVRDVETFARRYRAVTDHRLWSVESPVAGALVIQLPLTRLLSEVGRQFGDLRLQILGIIDKGDPAGMENAVKRLREFIGRLDQTCQTAAGSLKELAEQLIALDDGSRAVLDEAKNAGFLKPQIEAVDKLKAEIDALPELKLGTIADDLLDDNVVVVEANNKVRVVKFDEVWPVRQIINDPSLAAEEPQRAFNGDAAISAALLGLTRERPFATVVLTFFAPKEDPNARGFMRPQPPSLPVEELSTLRKRLEDSNFKVKEWDLGGTDPAPAPEEGTENIYIVLPPAPPTPPNPFGGPPPGKPFGPAERKKVEDVLAADGRVVFLTTWDVRPSGPFGTGLVAPKYEFADYLRDQWGITVESDYRVTWVIPDNRRPDQIAVSAERFQLMPVNYFTDHPIGAPFRTSTVKVTDASPIKLADTPPEGVKLEKILEIPLNEEYLGVDLRDLVTIINELNNPEQSGFVPRSPTSLRGPFTLMVAAEKEKAGRIVVCTLGRSFSDVILTRPVLRAMPDGRLVPEPPPINNAELLVNALYWLHGQERWIAAGPPAAPTVGPIPPQRMTVLRIVAYGIWPAAVFAPGLFIWLARRR